MASTVSRLRAQAQRDLQNLANAPRALQRRVYFVPGVSDESGASAWGDPSTTTDCMRLWVPRCFNNAASMVTWVTFFSDAAQTQPVEYHDFIRFGADLAKRIHADLGGASDEIDIVAHSMGGLDTVSAVALMDTPWDTEGVEPVRGVHHMISYDSPYCGSVNAGSVIFNLIKKAQGRGQEYLVAQGVAMQPDSDPIKTMLTRRDAFLRNVGAFWPRGASDYGGLIEVTHDSAAFGGTDGFSPEWRSRYRDYKDYSATEHAGPTGVTRDPRAIRDTFAILLGDVS